MKVHPHHAHRFWPLWGWPIALGLLTAIGLVSALFSDGGWGDALAWLALGAPVVAGLWFGWGRPREADQNACRMPKS